MDKMNEYMDAEMTNIKILEEVIGQMHKDHEAECNNIRNLYQQKLTEK